MEQSRQTDPDLSRKGADMTANEMIPAVGAHVVVAFEQVQVACTVLDVKTSWGKPRLLIAPLSGDGSQWIELSRLTRAGISKWKEIR
jgi:hypothetical protein